MISIGDNIWANTSTDTPAPTFASLKKLMSDFAAIPKPSNETLYVREMPPDIAALPASAQPISSLFGMKVKVSKSLPATIKDKDGNEVELIGLMVSEMTADDFERIMQTGEPENRMVLLTGKIVKAAGK